MNMRAKYLFAACSREPTIWYKRLLSPAAFEVALYYAPHDVIDPRDSP